MSYQQIDREKDATTATMTPIFSTPSQTRSVLQKYQLLVGDINAPADPNNDSLYAEIHHEERKATTWFFISGSTFFFCIFAQIILCLGIAVGAQFGLSRNQISELAAVNTAVAAVIAVLKGLSLPDKLGVERRKLQKIQDRIRRTTRKLRAGLNVDVDVEAEVVTRMYEEAEDESHILVGEVGNAVGSSSSSNSAVV